MFKHCNPLHVPCLTSSQLRWSIKHGFTPSVLQDELWDLCRLAAARVTGNEDDLIGLYGLQDLFPTVGRDCLDASDLSQLKEKGI